MLPAIPFYVLRHGQTVANAAEELSGQSDSPLNETGLAQARAAAEVFRLMPVKPAVIVHSHLSRARMTAEIVNTHIGAPLIEHPGVAEQDFGQWEGVKYLAVRDRIHAGETPPEGEGIDDFVTRIRTSFSDVISAHPGPVLIVCHGGVFRALGQIYGVPVSGVENAVPHHFRPLPSSLPGLPGPGRDIFPWDVTEYTLDTTTDTLHQSPARRFADALAKVVGA